MWREITGYEPFKRDRESERERHRLGERQEVTSPSSEREREVLRVLLLRLWSWDRFDKNEDGRCANWRGVWERECARARESEREREGRGREREREIHRDRETERQRERPPRACGRSPRRSAVSSLLSAGFTIASNLRHTVKSLNTGRSFISSPLWTP